MEEFNKRLKCLVSDFSLKLDSSWFDRDLLSVFLYTIRPFVLLALIYPVSIFFQGFTLFAVSFLLILISQRFFMVLVHDTSHSFFSRKKKLSDFLGNYLIAGFIGMTIQSYREVHHKHHKFNGSELDPEFFSRSQLLSNGLFAYCMKYILGFRVLSLINKYYSNQFSRLAGQKHQSAVDLSLLHVSITQLMLLMFFIGVGLPWLYFVWLYISVTFSPLLSRLRFICEHPDKYELTVTTKAPWWERFIFAPNNFNFHLEHHLWPSLPPYKLKDAHQYLLKKSLYSNNPSFLSDSFFKSLL